MAEPKKLLVVAIVVLCSATALAACSQSDNTTLPATTTSIPADTPTTPVSSEPAVPFDPEWAATVTVSCGSTPDSRTVEAFDATTNGAGDAVLYRGEHAGAGAVFTIDLGEEVPEQANFLWGINLVLLGPWPVTEIIDTCE